MKFKEFMKENISVIVLFMMLTVATSILMTACNAKVTPASPGIATVTNTPTGTPTITSTPNANATALPVGAISFTTWVRNGANQIGFVANQNISAGTTIYLTNLAWDGANSQFADESTTQTISGSGLAQQGGVTEIEEIIYYISGNLTAGQVVYIGDALNAAATVNQLQGGSVGIAQNAGVTAYFANSSPSGDSLTTSAAPATFLNPSGAYPANVFLNSGKSNAGHLFAYTMPASSAAPSAGNKWFPSGAVWTTGLIYGPDAFGSSSSSPTNYYDSALPASLTAGTNATDLSALYAQVATVAPTPYTSAVTGGENIVAFLGGTNTTANCPSSGFCTGSNWYGSVLGKSKFAVAPTPVGGAVACSNGYGFTFPATVTPVPY